MDDERKMSLLGHLRQYTISYLEPIRIFVVDYKPIILQVILRTLYIGSVSTNQI